MATTRDSKTDGVCEQVRFIAYYEALNIVPNDSKIVQIRRPEFSLLWVKSDSSSLSGMKLENKRDIECLFLYNIQTGVFQ